MVNHSDGELLKLLKEDSQQAFAQIYRRHWEALFITAAKALRGKEEAEDVLQDVFLSLWNRRKDLIIEHSLAAYLHTSVRYKVIHYIEKNITRRDYLVLLTEMAVHTHPASAEHQLNLKEVQQILGDAITKMPAKMQQVYRLSRMQNLSHKEIADQLGISTETVKKHIQHALQIIKTALENNKISSCLLLAYLLH
jgi:RNA polymerase sigma-70 factor (family 1)